MLYMLSLRMHVPLRSVANVLLHIPMIPPDHSNQQRGYNAWIHSSIFNETHRKWTSRVLGQLIPWWSATFFDAAGSNMAGNEKRSVMNDEPLSTGLINYWLTLKTEPRSAVILIDCYFRAVSDAHYVHTCFQPPHSLISTDWKHFYRNYIRPLTR